MFTESQEGRKSEAIVIDSQCSDQNLSCQQIICKHKQLQSQFENGVHRTTVQIVRLPSVLFGIYLVATLNRKMMHQSHVASCKSLSQAFGAVFTTVAMFELSPPRVKRCTSLFDYNVIVAWRLASMEKPKVPVLVAGHWASFNGSPFCAFVGHCSCGGHWGF